MRNPRLCRQARFLVAAALAASLISVLDSTVPASASNGWVSDYIGYKAFLSVSCTSSSFCGGSLSAGEVQLCTSSAQCSGTSWPTNDTLNRDVSVPSVSCTSTSFCAALDAKGNAYVCSTSTQCTGSSWTKTDIDGTSTVLHSVSCSSTFCAAVDGNGKAFTLTSGTWSSATTVSSGADLTTVSCVASTFCEAGDNSGNAYKFGGTSWTTQSGADGINPITSISCFSTTFFIAVDSSGHTSTYTGSWATPTSIDSGNAVKSVSCASATFCIAVDNVGKAFKFSGSWGSATSIDGANVIEAVSCPSTSFCMAGDAEGQYMTTADGTSWTAPVAVLYAVFESVSCSSTSFCMINDQGGGSWAWNGSAWTFATVSSSNPHADSCPATNACVLTDLSGNYLTYSGSWTGTTDFDGTNAVQSISCATTAFCVAVDASGNALAYNGTNWTTLTTWTNPIDSGKILNSVSCPAANFCLAVDNAGKAIEYTGGTSWTKLSIDGSKTMAGVSCTSSSFCATVDVSGNGLVCTTSSQCSGTSWTKTSGADSVAFNAVSCTDLSYCVGVDGSGNEVTFSGGSWGSVTNIDGTNAINAVDCVNDNYCIAADAVGNELTYAPLPTVTAVLPIIGTTAGGASVTVTGTGFDGETAVDFGASAGTSVAVASNTSLTVTSPAGSAGLVDVTVTTPNGTSATSSADQFTYVASGWANEGYSDSIGQNLAGDFYGTAMAGTTTVAVGDDSTGIFGQVSAASQAQNWTLVSDFNGKIWGASPTGADGSRNVDGISCASAIFCTAVDSSGDTFNYNGSSWSSPSVPTGASDLTSVSCTSSTFCMAVDHGSGRALYYNGSSWSAVAIDGISPFDLTSVSCTSSTFCMAVDTSGDAFDCSGTGCTGLSWSTSMSADSGNSLASVSCTSTSFCVAVDNAGNAATYNGSTWSVAGVHTKPLDSVSCTSTSFCMTVDNQGDSFTFNGSTWRNPWTNPVDSGFSLDTVTCTSSSFCIAGDNSGKIVTYNGSTWTAPLSVDSSNSLNASSCISVDLCVMGDSAGQVVPLSYNGTAAISAGALYSVACPSASACVAVGQNATYTGGAIVTSTNPTSADGWVSESVPSGVVYLLSVACPTTSDCYAVGTLSSGSAAIIDSTNGGVSWGTEAAPTLPAAATGLYGIACTSATVCFAAGTGTESGSTYGIVAYTTNASSGSSATWSIGATTSAGGLLTGIACTTTPVCIASGNAGSSSNYSMDVFIDSSLSGGSPSYTTWTKSNITTSPSNSYAYGVACETTTTCLAYGWTGGKGVIYETTSLTSPSWSEPENGSFAETAWYSMACVGSICTGVGSNNKSPYYPEATVGY